jgi:type II secretory ATPase GspE/PulE/Tfp pilus assembly ATPase PilB-like protein
MRDTETAEIAVQAALTGHLVLSTLHTNDAVSALVRLADLKVESYLIASTLDAVLAQRLVRRVCPECRERYQPDPAAVALLAGKPVGSPRLERGAGCAACRNTGYKGRTGIFELLQITEDMRRDISRSLDIDAVRSLARQNGMITLRENGWSKVAAGITTVEEVLRVTGD